MLINYFYRYVNPIKIKGKLCKYSLFYFIFKFVWIVLKIIKNIIIQSKISNNLKIIKITLFKISLFNDQVSDLVIIKLSLFYYNIVWFTLINKKQCIK